MSCYTQLAMSHSGQTVARLQSPEGVIVGISYASALRD